MMDYILLGLSFEKFEKLENIEEFFFSIPLFFEYYPYPLVDKCFLGFDLIDDNNHSSDVKHWIQTDTHWMRVMLHWIVVYT